MAFGVRNNGLKDMFWARVYMALRLIQEMGWVVGL